MSDDHSPHAALNHSRRLAVAKACPSLRIGDVWQRGVWGAWPAEVMGFEQLGQAWPWPKVRIRYRNGKEDSWGAPAFVGAELVTRGDGVEWRPLPDA